MVARRGSLVVVGCVALGGAILQASACAEFGAGDDGPASDAAADGIVEPVNESGADTSEASSACPPETCVGRTACELLDFSANTCDPFDISSSSANTVRDCGSGKLRLAASFTDDLTALWKRKPPTSGFSAVRVSFRLWAERWDGRSAIKITLGGIVAIMKIDDDQAKKLTFALCGESIDACATPTITFPAATEHAFAIDIDATRIALSADCKEVASVSRSGALGQTDELQIELGHTDAEPMNGEYDDVLVWFKPL